MSATYTCRRCGREFVAPTSGMPFPDDCGQHRTSDHGPASRPCGSCPYRRDVPSGVWSAEEYDKLPPYDADTPYQPPCAFFCHQQDGRLCAGWVGCHDMNESLGLRMACAVGMLDADDVEAARGYVCPVELWPSGAAAAEHGKAEISAPSERARQTMAKVTRRQRKLRPPGS